MKEYFVSPDEKILVDRQTGKISKQIVDADKYTAWRKKEYGYINLPLSSAF